MTGESPLPQPPSTAMTSTTESSIQTHSSHQASPVSNSYLKRSLPDESALDAENRRKTPKVSRACDLCKAKKVRCSGTLPCDICERKNLSCVYNARYARGKPRTPPAAADDNGSNPPRLLEAAHTSASRYESNGFSPALPERSVSHLSPEQEVVEKDASQSPSYKTLFIYRIWKRLADRVTEDAHESGHSVQSQVVMTAGDRPFDGPRPDRSSLPAPDRTFHAELLEYYFDFCVVTYRIFHRPTVEDWLETAFAEYDRHRNGWVESIGPVKSAVIFAMFAIASLRKQKIASLSPREEGKPSPRSDYFFNAAAWMTDSEMGFPTLESVQARLLQVLYLLQSLRMNEARYLFGMVVQMQSALGYHRKEREYRRLAFGLPEDYINTEVMKRTFWVAYTMDRYLAVVYGRPRHFPDEELSAVRPDAANDEEMTAAGNTGQDNQEDSHIESLRAHAEMAHFVGLITKDVYAAKTVATSDRCKHARRYSTAMHAWQDNLPPHLGSVRPSFLIPSFKRQSIALKLAFGHALVYANRPFLLSKPAYADHGDIQRCVDDCLAGARQVLDLFELMTKDQTLIHAYWWTSYVVFSALCVVYVWEISLRTHPDRGVTCVKLKGQRDLFDLAETGFTRLSSAPGAATPIQRYKIILEELRMEARQPRDAAQPAGSNLFSGWQTNDWVELDASVFDSFSDIVR
ncbi:hypothetical protein EJ05DRAFT_491811 [Pseudovirgaria hyperparasitica]|uniref:Zn(2)-C6 fungal-type domain-containing protein n=1 Tax=Pseudovirgaria hyperparasitica TaxID=470096 RepID=A0A6A6WG02_9PEZI|nr:uncharacterized protein EJ05DRAFT_491811 [Pseudovirgaria hyperparasitica]KAF2760960.1 hypothetical protein EJ05DRAFT_491811 [Pseudovirgaria hyperparasitica]